MMRWLADENIPRSAIAFLRSRGEDTAAIAELSPGIPDEMVIQVARTQDRILVSFDHAGVRTHIPVGAPAAMHGLRLRSQPNGRHGAGGGCGEPALRTP
jgi:predicted nuclease of predicted toxin-antitoxin system